MRQRYLCRPHDGTEEHKFSEPLPMRMTVSKRHRMCLNCHRPYHTNEGVPTGPHYVFALREQADVLIRVGRRESFRSISTGMRVRLKRKMIRGPHAGVWTSQEAHLAADYLDLVGPVVIERLAETKCLPFIQLDAKPLRRRQRRRLNPVRGKKRSLPWPQNQQQKPAGRKVPRKLLKYKRRGKVLEMGRILVVSGKDSPHDPVSRPILMRFARGGDELNWAETLGMLEGTPTWVVSDRDEPIINAVKSVWPKADHYFCEVHLAVNAAQRAKLDGVVSAKMISLLEHAQESLADWQALETEAQALKARSLSAWIKETTPLMLRQFAMRPADYPKDGYPHSAGATEATILALGPIVGRRFTFRNADRLDRILALVTLELAGRADKDRYTRIIRNRMRRLNPEIKTAWREQQDPLARPSIDERIADSEQRQATMLRLKNSAASTARRWANKASMRGPGAPKSRTARTGSVAGKTVADFPDLVAEWDDIANETLRPADVPAGSGRKVFWKCPKGQITNGRRKSDLERSEGPTVAFALIAISPRP